MNPEAKEFLDKILEKDPSELSEYEAEFLRARRTYLKKSQTEEYASILNQTPKMGTVKNVKTPTTN